MRKAVRRESAAAWLASGAQVTVKTYAKRYGVDRYTAREDLGAIGLVFAPGDTRWSVRPEPVPRTARLTWTPGRTPKGAGQATGSIRHGRARVPLHRCALRRQGK
jgi:hypothetical protein